jgi:hypothetical protein
MGKKYGNSLVRLFVYSCARGREYNMQAIDALTRHEINEIPLLKLNRFNFIVKHPARQLYFNFLIDLF